jgi:hypothetical protein
MNGFASRNTVTNAAKVPPIISTSAFSTTSCIELGSPQISLSLTLARVFRISVMGINFIYVSLLRAPITSCRYFAVSRATVVPQDPPPESYFLIS